MTDDSQLPSSLNKARRTVQEALLKLAATGDGGFEGFIRDSLTEFTGLGFGLVKSGQQKGVDARTQSVSTEIAIGIEAKRYRDHTHLPLDSLVAKLVDAAERQEDPLDLWTLVASKPVSADDVIALNKVGERHGVGVVVLDWRSEGASLSPLQLLIAATPKAVAHHLPGDRVRRAMTVMLAATTPLEIENFRSELSYPELGLHATIRFVADELRRGLSNRTNARSRLGSPVNILEPSAHWANRTELSEKLTHWHSGSSEHPIGVVLGDEGAGKTAATLKWLIDRMSSDQQPLAIHIEARDLAASDLDLVLAQGLCKWTQRRSVEYWQRRLRQWAKFQGNSSNVPPILLIIDGLNEGEQQHRVVRLFDEVCSDRWIGRVSILATDRTRHWRRTFEQRYEAYDGTAEFEIGAFKDSDLEHLLERYGKKVDEFPNELVSIIKWPSWFGVASALFDQVTDWKIYSPEQLMLEYWVRRSKMLGRIGAPLAAEFQNFVAALGKQALEGTASSGFSKLEIKDLLVQVVGDESRETLDVVQDIVDGKWLRSLGQNRFEISEGLLPFALALTLLDELKDASSFEAADAICEEVLLPFEDRDIGVSILKAATVLSATHSPVPEHIRAVLFLRWATQHNFKNWHFDVFWKSATHCVPILLETTEQCWLSLRGGLHTDEILVKALANIMEENSNSAPLILSFIEKWLSVYWLDPHEGLFIGKPANDEKKEQRIAQTGQRHNDLMPIVRSAGISDSTFSTHDEGYLIGTLSRKLCALMSFLPRARFRAALSNWAISRALMDEPHTFEELAWLLRYNKIDPNAARAMVNDIAQDLVDLASPQFSKAARWLLLAEGSVASAQEAERVYPDAHRTPAPSDWKFKVHDGEVTSPPQFQEHPKRRMVELATLTPDPNLRLKQTDIEAVASAANEIVFENVAIGRSSTAEDDEFQSTVDVLSRWRPQDVQDICGRFLDTLKERSDEDKLWGFVHALPPFLLFLSDFDRARMEEAASARLKAKAGKELDTTFDGLVSALMFDRKAREQAAAWTRIGVPARINSEFKRHLKRLSNEALTLLAAEIDPEAPAEQIIPWLSILVVAGVEDDCPQLPSSLADLLSHPSDTVRCLVFELGVDARDKSLAHKLFESGWRHDQEDEDGTAWFGSQLLIQATTDANIQEITSRIAPRASGSLWGQMNFDRALADPFRCYVSDTIEFELRATGSRGFGGVTYYHFIALEKLLNLGSHDYKEKFRELIAGSKFIDMIVTDWPIREFFAYFGKHDPEFFIEMWKLTQQRMKGRAIDVANLKWYPFEALTTPEVDVVRREIISSATSDEEIVELARLINENGLADWAISVVRSLISDPDACAADAARALTLAAYLSPTNSVRQFWAGSASEFPLGWLADVRTQAQMVHEKRIFLQDWLSRLEHAESDENVFACWRMIARLADRDSLPSIRSSLGGSIREKVSTRHFDYLRLNFMKLVQRVKQNNSRRKSELFFTRRGSIGTHAWAE